MKSLVLFFFVYASAAVSALDFRLLSPRQTTVKTVNTTSGLVSGHASSNTSAQVSEYLGIPYAEPPIGDLRFALPVRFSGSSGINGTNFVGHFLKAVAQICFLCETMAAIHPRWRILPSKSG
jgi:hypothetical protein